MANRSDPDLEQVVGPFTNSVVLRVDASGDPSFLELLGRVRSTTLDADEVRECPGRHHPRGDDGRRAEATVLSVDQRIGGRDEAERHEHLAADVCTRPRRVRALGQHHRTDDGRREGCRRLSHEHDSPTTGRQAQPGNDGPGGEREPRRGRPAPKDTQPPVVVGMDLPQQGQGSRLRACGAKPLHNPAGDQYPPVLRGRGDNSTDTEHTDSGDERAPPAVPVANDAAGEQQARERNDVARNHPLQ